MNLKTAIGQFRLTCLLEGLSLLILLFIAMPLKYYFDYPIVVKIVGAAHGGLFVLYIIYTLFFAIKLSWGVKMILLVSLASFIPFGTFYVDKKVLAKID
ncbi:DUF3817 domain-containing protein [Pedobacter alpinus]|uniref:DUF3817 domain-containing protein n=1 Tax=Pedobacter alpinus TaxID=1590643 RepID=A0ABW5TXI8_9SPHI